jgi:hypothetical protein
VASLHRAPAPRPLPGVARPLEPRGLSHRLRRLPGPLLHRLLVSGNKARAGHRGHDPHRRPFRVHSVPLLWRDLLHLRGGHGPLHRPGEGAAHAPRDLPGHRGRVRMGHRTGGLVLPARDLHRRRDRRAQPALGGGLALERADPAGPGRDRASGQDRGARADRARPSRCLGPHPLRHRPQVGTGEQAHRSRSRPGGSGDPRGQRGGARRARPGSNRGHGLPRLGPLRRVSGHEEGVRHRGRGPKGGSRV